MDGPTSTRFPRGFRPAVAALESRELQATAVSTLMITPAILSPPNGRYVQVTVSGKVIESSEKVTPKARFQVVDEYARIQPGGVVTLTKQTPTVYTYRFTITLQASRASVDTSGRQYNVIVGAQDNQNAHGLAVSALVPQKTITPTKSALSVSVKEMRRWKGRS